jgi:hypothetical protein
VVVRAATAAETSAETSSESPMNRTRIIIQTMITLASAALGLVAALA